MANHKKNITEAQEIKERHRFEFGDDAERADREIDTRDRDDFYDLPDVDSFNYEDIDVRKLQLMAPPPRVDERHGKMRQHWVAFKHNNGRRVQDLIQRGYRVRRPETVPLSFQGFTEKWQAHDVIMVAGEHILMETSETIYKAIQLKKIKHNNSIIQDISSQHGQIIRDGKISDEQLPNAGRFTEEVVVNRSQEGRDISFAD